MRKKTFISCTLVGVAFLSGETSAQNQKSSSKSTTNSKKTTGSKKATARKTSWRSTQRTPTPQRYKEIQQALADKGYLQAGAPNGVWDSSSVEALKRFQSDQNLEASGKIDSLSLIALGLGPRRDPQPAPRP